MCCLQQTLSKWWLVVDCNCFVITLGCFDGSFSQQQGGPEARQVVVSAVTVECRISFLMYADGLKNLPSFPLIFPANQFSIVPVDDVVVLACVVIERWFLVSALRGFSLRTSEASWLIHFVYFVFVLFEASAEAATSFTDVWLRTLSAGYLVYYSCIVSNGTFVFMYL